jgi:hypothetical protein
LQQRDHQARGWLQPDRRQKFTNVRKCGRHTNRRRSCAKKGINGERVKRSQNNDRKPKYFTNNISTWWLPDTQSSSIRISFSQVCRK